MCSSKRRVNSAMGSVKIQKQEQSFTMLDDVVRSPPHPSPLFPKSITTTYDASERATQ